jgi:hypothetical protein
MKKLISILSITAAALMLSSCIILGTDEEPEIVVKKEVIKEKETVTETAPATTTTTQTQQPAQQTTPAQTTVITKPEPEPAKYSITCRNQTNMIVTDWCVSKDNIVTYANSSFNRAIGPYKEDKIQNLPEGYYKVYFSFEDDGPLSPSDYLSSDSIQLNQDVIYTLFVRTSGYAVDCRSAATPAPQYYLAGSDGSEIDLF